MKFPLVMPGKMEISSKAEQSSR